MLTSIVMITLWCGVSYDYTKRERWNFNQYHIIELYLKKIDNRNILKTYFMHSHFHILVSIMLNTLFYRQTFPLKKF